MKLSHIIRAQKWMSRPTFHNHWFDVRDMYNEGELSIFGSCNFHDVKSEHAVVWCIWLTLTPYIGERSLQHAFSYLVTVRLRVILMVSPLALLFIHVWGVITVCFVVGRLLRFGAATADEIKPQGHLAESAFDVCSSCLEVFHPSICHNVCAVLRQFLEFFDRQ